MWVGIYKPISNFISALPLNLSLLDYTLNYTGMNTFSGIILYRIWINKLNNKEVDKLSVGG
jgi:hypothetical protein